MQTLAFVICDPQGQNFVAIDDWYEHVPFALVTADQIRDITNDDPDLKRWRSRRAAEVAYDGLMLKLAEGIKLPSEEISDHERDLLRERLKWLGAAVIKEMYWGLR